MTDADKTPGQHMKQKRRRNSSTPARIRRFLFLCAESRQRNVTLPFTRETSRDSKWLLGGYSSRDTAARARRRRMAACSRRPTPCGRFAGLATRMLRSAEWLEAAMEAELPPSERILKSIMNLPRNTSVKDSNRQEEFGWRWDPATCGRAYRPPAGTTQWTCG